MSANTNITEQVKAMRRVNRAARLAGPQVRASRIPSGKAYSRRPKHAAKGWS